MKYPHSHFRLPEVIKAMLKELAKKHTKGNMTKMIIELIKDRYNK